MAAFFVTFVSVPRSGAFVVQRLRNYDFPDAIAARKSAFVFVFPIFDSSSSIASVGEERRQHARKARDRVEQEDEILLVLDQTLRLLDDHRRNLSVPLRRLVEGRRGYLAAHRALHDGYFFRPLVDEQHDQIDLGVVPRDAVRFAAARARQTDDRGVMPGKGECRSPLPRAGPRPSTTLCAAVRRGSLLPMRSVWPAPAAGLLQPL